MTEQIAPQVFKRGFGLKSEVSSELNQRYNQSDLIDHLKAHNHTLTVDEVTVCLAQEFGFCYGVDKAVDFAYEARRYFPDRRIFLTDEIIHNPRVNQELMSLGVGFLSGTYRRNTGIDDLKPQDVVLIPAFGTTTVEEEKLRQKGCVLVDTTCGSVVHVWKRVEKYAQEGFTSVIHGKYHHEETRATSSRVTITHGAPYAVVRDQEQAGLVCRYIIEGGDRDLFLSEFKGALSPGFDPDRHLERIGVANQTTMLASESLHIAQMIKASMIEKFGASVIDQHFRSFDTICSATQDRQDALLKLVERPDLSLFLVIGGYNSSNTGHLLEIASRVRPAYHVQDASDLVSSREIRHKPLTGESIKIDENWLPEGPVVVGVTSGASTPNRVTEEVILRLFDLRGISADELSAQIA